MTTDPRHTDDKSPTPRRPRAMLVLALIGGFAVASAVIAALLVNIFARKQEAKNPYLRFVDVGENTTNPAEWGKNWPRQYDGYLRTSSPSRTKYGGGAPSEGALPPKRPWTNPG